MVCHTTTMMIFCCCSYFEFSWSNLVNLCNHVVRYIKGAKKAINLCTKPWKIHVAPILVTDDNHQGQPSLNNWNRLCFGGQPFIKEANDYNVLQGKIVIIHFISCWIWYLAGPPRLAMLKYFCIFQGNRFGIAVLYISVIQNKKQIVYLRKQELWLLLHIITLF